MQPSSKTMNSLPMQQPPTKRQRLLQRDKSSQVKRTMLISSPVLSGDSSSEEGYRVHSARGYQNTLYLVQKKQVNNGYIATLGTKLTSIQEEQVKEKIQSLHSDIPMFVAVMRKTNAVLRFVLDVPNCYSQNYLGDEESVLLQRHGQTWKVRFCGRIRGSLNHRRFQTGWKKFVQDNNLKMGDICLFERLSNQRSTLNVHIIPCKKKECP